MTGRFFITGLPRSRTAWLAVVSESIFGGEASCVHEPTAEAESWMDACRFWERDDRDFLGIADSCLGLHVAEILDRWRPQTLIVERPVADVGAALAKAGLPVSLKALGLLQRRLDAVRDHTFVRTIAYSRLNEVGEVCDVLKWLLPGAVPDERRVARLMGMNIQASVDRAKAAAARTIKAGNLAGVVGTEFLDELMA